MRAFILSAGRGSRLQSYTKDRPKCLVELGGMTLIDHQLATLRALGVHDIVVVTGYRAEMLALPGTRQICNQRWSETNMVESLFAAESLFLEDFIVSYGDIVYEPRTLKALLESPHEISVVVDRQWRAYWTHRFSDPLADAESLRMNAEGCITDIGNSVTAIDEIEAQYIGLMRFRGNGVKALSSARMNLRKIFRPFMEKRTPERAYMTDVLMEIILMGGRVHAVPIDGGWLEIDTETDYEDAAAMFADGSIRQFYDDAAISASTR